MNLRAGTLLVSGVYGSTGAHTLFFLRLAMIVQIL